MIIKLKGINKGYLPPELQIETNDEKLSESRCFVATVCYGSEMHKSVLFLQDFRDTRLLTNKIGKEIVCIYYRHGPMIAKYVEKKKMLKSLIRNWFLKPLVLILKFFLRFT